MVPNTIHCPVSEHVVRPARADDTAAVAPLLYESATGMYDRFAGGPARALSVIAAAVERPGTNASTEVVTVAELDGRVTGAMSSFPVSEAAARARAFLRVTLRELPPWRWPPALWLYRAGADAAPAPPEDTLYVDALAVDAGARRRGVGIALLAGAEAEARRRGLTAVSLDTALDNKPARALYLEAGFEEMAYRPAGRGLPGFVALVKPVS
jgi:ribosomal protein S18 acetylase RimI-like enzyme